MYELEKKGLFQLLVCDLDLRQKSFIYNFMLFIHNYVYIAICHQRSMVSERTALI